MQILKLLILSTMHNIKARIGIKDRILTDSYWQVSRSGKVLEFSVVESIDTNPEIYRLGIIQIGRIIYKFESFAKNKVSKPQIQLFPNLTEGKLAATIYWPDFLSSTVQFNPEPGTKRALTVESLRALSEKYSLSMRFQGSESSTINDCGSKTHVDLWSASNQPFIWLKTGQLIEELMLRFDLSFNSAEEIIKIITPARIWPFNDKSGYLQMEVSIPPS